MPRCSLTLAFALTLALLSSCASVEELVAEGDLERQRGNHARASELYWQAYHKDHRHPLVKARLGNVRQAPGTND